MDEQIPNDFGKSTSRVYVGNTQPRRQIAERINSISITKLRKTDAFAERNIVRFNFLMGKTWWCFKKDPRDGDMYLELVYPGPKNNCTVVNFAKTKCNLGGKREWFICPSCGDRFGVLYEHDDNFSCRRCFVVQYSSQLIDYRNLEATLRRVKLLETAEQEVRWQTYKGKPTKRAMRYEKLRAKVDRGLRIFGSRFT